MEVDQSREDGVYIFVVSGEFDVFNVQTFKSAVADLPFSEGLRALVDLSGTPYADSTALGSILALHKRVTEGHGRLALQVPAGSVRDLLRITKVDKLFTVCETRDEALTALRS